MSEGRLLTVDEGQALINQNKTSHLFKKEDVKLLLDIDGCMGIRAHRAVHINNVPTLILTAVGEDGKDILAVNVVVGAICDEPPYCHF